MGRGDPAHARALCIVGMDLAGHGKSGPIRSARGLQEFADDVRRVWDHLGHPQQAADMLMRFFDRVTTENEASSIICNTSISAART
jgi:pimeloyl-ACP methyl ester carboxylesterase